MEITGTIEIVKCGSVLKEFPLELYELFTLPGGTATIIERSTRKTVFVLSSSYYDYVEVTYDTV